MGYETFPPGTPITTWSPGQSTAELGREWQNAGAAPIRPDANTAVGGQVSLAPNVPQTVAGIAGPASIQSVKLTVPGVTAAAGIAAQQILDHTWIKIFWDGQAAPAVSAPLGSFFGLGQFGCYPDPGPAPGTDPT